MHPGQVMGKRYQFRGLPKWGSRDKQRCGAKLHGKLAACRRWPVPGRTRCRLHGGMSTGARTPEGKARVLAALIEGRQRWMEEMRAKKKAGLIVRFPGGRKSGTASRGAKTAAGAAQIEPEHSLGRRWARERDALGVGHFLADHCNPSRSALIRRGG